MRALLIGRIRGIELRAHWSLLIIVLLVAMSIAQGEVPTTRPDWSAGAAWWTGAAVGIGLVASIALHELAHALMSQRVGIPVPRITLFVFGGMAEIAERPTRAAHEFAITVVGPLTSLVLGGGLLLAAGDTNADAAASAGAVLALTASILGQVNIVLAIFNCLPGTPLDGGRLLHAAIWRATGSEARASLYAARSGQAIGGGLSLIGLLMLFGVDVPWFGTGAGGLWLVLIGWFVASLARAEQRSFEVEQVSGSVAVVQLARATPVARAEMPLDVFADGVLLTAGEHALPIVDDGDVVGLACLHDVLRVPAADRPLVPVSSVMTPWDRVQRLDATATIRDAALMFARFGFQQLPLQDPDDGHVVGMVRRPDVAAWIELHADQPDGTTRAR